MSNMSIFKPTYLYVKQHKDTGLLYFGKTSRKDPVSYTGSGKYWKRHLKAHGNDVQTIWIDLFDSESDLTEFAEFFSSEFDIVNSTKWANLKIENGLDGGGIKGFIQSQEQREKTRQRLIGKKLSDATKLKIRKSKKGKKLSEEHRANVVNAVKVISPESRVRMGWNRNGTHSEDHCSKIKLSKIGKKMYIGPNGERKMYLPGQQPQSFVKAKTLRDNNATK